MAKLKVTWVADFNAQMFEGGAELTARELMQKGTERGHLITEVTSRSASQLPADSDLLVLNNLRFFRLESIMRFLDRKFVYFCHDPQELPVHAHLFGLAQKVYFCSPAQQRFFTQGRGFPINSNKIVLCPAPIDVDKFTPAAKKNGAVYVGELGMHKGFDNLLAYAQKNPALSLELYGKKDPGLEIPALPNLHYKGKVPYEQVPAILAHAQIAVHLPNWLECYGRSVMEAYLSGCELVLNGNVGAMSYDWNWSDRAAVREKIRHAPDLFWDSLEALG